MILSNIKGYKHQFIWEKSQGANFATVKYQPYKVHEEINVFTQNGDKVNYYPQMTEGKPYTSGLGDSGEATGKMKKTQTINKGTRYPRSIQHFKQQKNGLHPTQKPVKLMEYLVKTYTNKGDTILDFTMGSGSTGVACVNTKRNFIGIELDEKYFETAEERIRNNDLVEINEKI